MKNRSPAKNRKIILRYFKYIMFSFNYYTYIMSILLKCFYTKYISGRKYFNKIVPKL